MADVAMHLQKEALESTAEDGDEAPPLIPMPFKNIPSPPREPRAVGVWVHPRERGLREWYMLKCRCNTDVTFPWLGFQAVTCPACGTNISSSEAVTAPTPMEAVQKQAQADEKHLEEMFATDRMAHNAAKKLAKRWTWLKQKGDTFEKLLLGRPFLYGNFKMYCHGRIILSPSSSFCIFPPLIVAPPLIAAYNLAGVPPFLLQAAAVVLVLAFAAITIAHFTEPGIQRKGPPVPACRDICEVHNGHTIVKKWCTTCNCYRPPRGSHCAECDVCVDDFDHHCYVTGTCVGRRNYRPFVAFVCGIAIADILGIIIFALKLVHIAHPPLTNQLQQNMIATFGLIYTILTSYMMCNMACLTCFMIGNNLKTRELLKRIWTPERNQYNLGSRCANIREFLRSPPPSLIWGKAQSELESPSPL